MCSLGFFSALFSLLWLFGRFAGCCLQCFFRAREVPLLILRALHHRGVLRAVLRTELRVRRKGNDAVGHVREKMNTIVTACA